MSALRSAGLGLALLTGLLTTACSGPTSPSGSSVIWSGTTSQGMSISFTVSSGNVLRSLTIGHNFNGCSGAETFSNLEVVILNGVLGFESGERGTGPTTTVVGVLPPFGQAHGAAYFQNFPGCGSAVEVDWTAQRQ